MSKKLVIGTGVALLLTLGGGGGYAWLRGGPKPLSEADQKELDKLGKDLGMKSMAAKTMATFPLRLEFPEVCFMGDLDAILLDLKWVPKSKVLLTFEALGETEKRPSFAFELDKGQLYDSKPMKVDLKVPVSRDLKDYGLYVCIDSKDADRCGKKAVMSYDKIFEQNSNEAIAEEDARSGYRDKIFFFNHVLTDGRSLRAVTNLVADDPAKLDRLTDYLKLRAWSAPKAAKIGARIKKLVRTLGSMPLVMDKSGELVLQLPIQNIMTCDDPPKDL